MHRRTRGREESLPAFPLLQHPLRHARWDPSADGRVRGGTGLGTQADAIPRPALQVILWLEFISPHFFIKQGIAGIFLQ